MIISFSRRDEWISPTFVFLTPSFARAASPGRPRGFIGCNRMSRPGIHQLEQDLGVSLFIREGKRLHLTPAGHLLIDYADRLLALADEARNAVQDPRPRGLFRLGAMESTAAIRLPKTLAEFHRRYPEVTLQLRTGNPQQLASAILAGELDAALVAEPIAEGQFEKTPPRSLRNSSSSQPLGIRQSAKAAPFRAR